MRNFLAKTAVGVFLAVLAGLVFFRAQPVLAQSPAPTSTTTTGTSAGAAFEYLGVNMHDLTNEPEDKQESYFAYLKKCNINTVRVFGTKEKADGNGASALAATAGIAGRHGIKIIAALGDYANGSENIPGDIRANPTDWYSGGYIGSGYSAYVDAVIAATRGVKSNILALELANEPHCNGFPTCFTPYENWMKTIGARIAGDGYKVSTGMGTLDKPDTPDTPGNPTGPYFNNISASNGISLLSTHWYPETQPGKEAIMEEAAKVAEQNGDEIILGEIGFECNSSPCTNSSNDEERARKMLQKMGEFAGYGYDGFLYWQFSGFKSNHTANDQFSWFAVGPDDVDNPFCKAFREGVVEPEEAIQPLLLYPRNSTEVSKYLSNSQVYCAPKQVFEPVDPSVFPILTPCTPAGDQDPGEPYASKVQDGNPCNSTQYPLVHGEEKYNFSNMAFPLFRNQSGGISIELDLSKITAGETIAAALQRGGRANYGPQFYLTSPETQCLNAVRYVQYVQRLCGEWAQGKPPDSCGANIPVTLQDGGTKRVLELASQLGSEAVCANFSRDVQENNEKAKTVASLQPYTPKVFKIGFLVQHTWLYGRAAAYQLINQFLTEHIALWLEGTQGDPGFGEDLGERLTITPIWYHAGITPDEYDQLQTQPYSYDPTNLPTEPTANPSNFAGPLWRTYSPLLPDYVQKSIVAQRIEEVDKNYQFLRQVLDRNLIGSSYTLSYKGQNVVENLPAIIECERQKCLCINRPGDEQCQNEDIEDLRKAFPDTFPLNQITDEYLLDLKKQIVARIYGGVQQSVAYPTVMNTINGPANLVGPLSNRSWGQCKLDLDNKNAFFGMSEAVQSISSSALQALNDINEQPDPQNVREAITDITTTLVAKVMAGSNPFAWINRQYEQRTARAYIVLPDEALDIDIAQAYITPMFLSPDMYESIMSGENPIYPFNLDDQGNPKPAEEKQVLSAFLRTIGLSRSIEQESAEGYVQIKTKQYAVECEVDDPANCECSGTVISENPTGEWVEYDGERELQEPSVDNGCVKEEIDKESLVGIKKAPDGKSPNENPQTPGQLQALNEFLRRAVFTPLHLQVFTAYPGLEQFYIGSGTSALNPTDTGNPAASNECVYKQPREIVPTIKNNAQLRDHICSVAQDPYITALTLAIWRIEGGRARNSIDLGGSTSYTCAPNRSGAIPPMNIVIGICSDGRIPADFRREMNTLTPDLCQVEDALGVGIQKISGDFRTASRQNSSLDTSDRADLKELFARASHFYIGTGYDCGDYRVDDDGADLSGGGGLDYCGYAAVRAMEYLDDLPSSCR